MRIDHTFNAHKLLNGRIVGYTAQCGDLITGASQPSKPEALADLAKLVAFRLNSHSDDVNVIAVRGHVGIFSWELGGYVRTQHVWPDGHVSLISGDKTFRTAEDSFRHHVAQQTWDGTLGPCDILPDSLQLEFRSWCEFQLRYRIAKSRGMTAVDAHGWACDSSNPCREETAA